MGTNFYLLKREQRSGCDHDIDGNPVVVSAEIINRLHLGKRSAAGAYCWDCDVTLCKTGSEGIHYSRHNEWYDACPRCGHAYGQTGDIPGPALIELGFQAPPTVRPRGVSGCCSFSWAQDPERIGPYLQEHADDLLVEDEYGRQLTCGYFLAMLRAICPVQYTDSVGAEFS